MKKKNNKGLAVVGLLAVCVILAAVLFMLSQGPKGVDTLHDMDGATANITPNEITGVPDEINVVPDEINDVQDETEAPDVSVNEIVPIDANPITVRPGVIQPNEPPVDSGTSNNIQLTEISARPAPPELPDTAFMGEPPEEATLEDVEAHEALDPALKNPDVKPNITPAPVTPVPTPSNPNEQNPQSPNRQNGQIYIPGFGWIKDEGGGGQGEKSSSDGDWDKIIGH